MFDMSSLATAKKKASTNYEKSVGDFEVELKEGIRLFTEFASNQNTEILKKSADKFFDAIRAKRSRVEPYIYLSYIFYMLDNNDSAKRYLDYAKSIDSTRREILDLQRVIYS
ncbi:MAG: hypothetical protein U0354_15750 [Candidatus Sericytochromatia bacterium]